MHPLDPNLEHRRLSAFYERADLILAWPRAELLEPVERVSRWSPAKHLFHIALANELALRNVASLAAGRGRQIKPFDHISELGARVLASGRYPRGKSQAPRMVTPPERVDEGILRELVASNRSDLEKLRPRLADLARLTECIPHQELGDLTGSQWLRFARVHAMHHLFIVRDIRRARRAQSAG